MTVMRPRLALPRLALKRVFDFVVSLVGLILLAPLFAAIAIGTGIDVHKDRQFGTWRVLVLPHVGTGTFNEEYDLK